eukprot:gene2743-2782_t
MTTLIELKLDASKRITTIKAQRLQQSVGKVAPNTVSRLEAGERVNRATVKAIQAAYQEAGIKFEGDRGVYAPLVKARIKQAFQELGSFGDDKAMIELHCETAASQLARFYDKTRIGNGHAFKMVGRRKTRIQLETLANAARGGKEAEFFEAWSTLNMPAREVLADNGIYFWRDNAIILPEDIDNIISELPKIPEPAARKEVNIQPLNSTTDTKRFIGCGHTTLYKLLGTGALQARKLGGKTLITGRCGMSTCARMAARLEADRVEARASFQAAMLAREENRQSTDWIGRAIRMIHHKLDRIEETLSEIFKIREILDVRDFPTVDFFDSAPHSVIIEEIPKRLLKAIRAAWDAAEIDEDVAERTSQAFGIEAARQAVEMETSILTKQASQLFQMFHAIGAMMEAPEITQAIYIELMEDMNFDLIFPLSGVALGSARHLSPSTSRLAPPSSTIPNISAYRLDRLTKGEPPPRKFALAPLFPLGTVGVIYGPGGVGKSLIAMDFCSGVARRTLPGVQNKVLMMGPLGASIPPEAGGASLMVTLEDDTAELNRRRKSLDPNGDSDEAPVYVVPAVDIAGFDPTLITTNGRAVVLTALAMTGLERMMDEVQSDAGHPVRLLVLDPAGDFISADENSADAVKPLMRRLREIAAKRNCTIILLGHVAKSNDGAMPTMRGSGAWIANARAAYAVWPPTEAEMRANAKKANCPANQLVWGCLAKANHGGAPVGNRRLFRRDPDTGRLMDITSLINPAEGASNGEALAALVKACAIAAEAGMPFALHNVGGLFEQKDDLPAPLSGMTKKALISLGEQALEQGALVKARNGTTGAPKFLDVPNGPLALGRIIPTPTGSRREAISQIGNRAI